jgi:hypothetical protein
MSNLLPFQVQKRTFGNKTDYWIILSKTPTPKKEPDKETTLFYVITPKVDDLFLCKGKHFGGVGMREDKTTELWECGDGWNPNQSDCEVVGQGVWKKRSDKRLYTLDFTEDVGHPQRDFNIGRRTVFSFGARDSKGWRRGMAHPKQDLCKIEESST